MSKILTIPFKEVPKDVLDGTNGFEEAMKLEPGQYYAIGDDDEYIIAFQANKGLIPMLTYNYQWKPVNYESSMSETSKSTLPTVTSTDTLTVDSAIKLLAVAIHPNAAEKTIK